MCSLVDRLHNLILIPLNKLCLFHKTNKSIIFMHTLFYLYVKSVFDVEEITKDSWTVSGMSHFVLEFLQTLYL